MSLSSLETAGRGYYFIVLNIIYTYSKSRTVGEDGKRWNDNPALGAHSIALDVKLCRVFIMLDHDSMKHTIGIPKPSMSDSIYGIVITIKFENGCPKPALAVSARPRHHATLERLRQATRAWAH